MLYIYIIYALNRIGGLWLHRYGEFAITNRICAIYFESAYDVIDSADVPIRQTIIIYWLDFILHPIRSKQLNSYIVYGGNNTYADRN